MRKLKSLRYLYTAKRNEAGKLIYLIDGLDMDAKDFAYPGDPIEEEVIPYLEAVLDGEISFSQDIIDTHWGHIFAAFYPVYSKDNPEEVQRIRENTEKMKIATKPIIAMTANAFDEDRQATKNAGMDVHLSKPLDGKEVIRVIARCCRK